MTGIIGIQRHWSDEVQAMLNVDRHRRGWPPLDMRVIHPMWKPNMVEITTSRHIQGYNTVELWRYTRDEVHVVRTLNIGQAVSFMGNIRL